MLGRVLQQILRIGATVASALAGLGGLATAVGFLAERARWSMLGFTPPGADLNEYLFTGARFLAFLPGIVLGSVLSAIALDPLLLLPIGVTGTFMYMLYMFLRVQRRFAGHSEGEGSRLRTWKGRLMRKGVALFRPAALGGLVLVLFVGTFFLFQAGATANSLFADRTHLEEIRCGEGRLNLQDQLLLQCEDELMARMGRVFLLVLAGGGALGLLMPSDWRGPGEGSATSPLESTLLWIAVALVMLQVLLIPINYGATFPRNDFPAVQVTRAPVAAPAQAAGPIGTEGAIGSPGNAAPGSGGDSDAFGGMDSWPADGRFSLIHRSGDEFYLYSAAARRIWLVPRGQLESLVYLGICDVFESPHLCGPGVTPTMESGAP